MVDLTLQGLPLESVGLRCWSLRPESVNSRVADHVGGMVHALAPGPFATLGSLYSGCFDELGRGLYRVLGPLLCVFVAELDEGKRKVLEDAFVPSIRSPMCPRSRVSPCPSACCDSRPLVLT